MLSSLPINDRRVLQLVHAQLQTGDAQGAFSRFETLPQLSREHPSGLFLKSLILQALARWEEALDAMEAARTLAPDDAAILNGYGNLLDDMGRSAEAVQPLQRATELLPDNNDYAINLGIVAIAAGRLDVAEASLARAIRAAPGVARSWAALALLEQQRGKPDLAARLYARAVELDPEDARTRHNLAVLLREDERPDEALAQIDEAVGRGPIPPETATLRAQLYSDLGRFDEAVAEYRSVAMQVPGHLHAHESHALLLRQLGRDAEAVDTYRTALRALPTSETLWRSALESTAKSGNHIQLAAWGQEAEGLIGATPDVRIGRAKALAHMGNASRAVALLREIVDAHAGNGRLHCALAEILIATGDYKTAEAHALRATEIEPQDQQGWSLLTVLWRLLEDTREAWLADYSQLVMPVDLDAAPGFFKDMSARLEAFHGVARIRSNLFDRKDPLLVRLVAQIRSAVYQCLRDLPDVPGHPFYSRKAARIEFVSSSSERLGVDARYYGDVPETGWLSGIFLDSGAGDLAFGQADPAFEIDLPARRTERARAGRLILFPSYLRPVIRPASDAAAVFALRFDALPVE